MRRICLALATALWAPSLARSQSVDFAPSVGFYVPMGSLVEKGSKSNSATYLEQRLQSTPAVGLRLTVWTSARLGFEGSLVFSPTDVAQSDSFGTADHNSAVTLLAARAIFAFTPMPFKPPPGRREIPWSFYIAVGPAIAGRGGDVWSSYSTGLTSPALLLDFGVRTPLGSRVILRLDADNYLSRTQFDSGLPTETMARFHNDLMVGVAIAYRLKR